MTHLTVVVPVFNEGSLIEELVRRVKSNVESITTNFELILVDDGSVDQTWELIRVAATHDNRIKAIKFSRNFGHHYAITAGLHRSVGEWIVVMDGDLQDRPEVIPELYKKVNEGFEIAFVSRINRPEKLYYRVVQKIFYWILRKLSGINFDSRQANFSIINQKVVKAFMQFPESARFYSSTIKWLGFKATSIEANHGQRFSGKPSYTIKKRFALAFDVIISFSERPLRFAIYLGTFVTLVSLVGSISILLGKFDSGYLKISFPTLLFSIFFLAGVTLTMLGLIGVYVGRIFNQVKNRPLYIIAEEINF